MGYEKTPPASKLVIITGIASSVFLLGLIPFFHAYFNDMVAAEYQAKVLDAPNSQRDEVEEAQAGNLASGSPSLEEAMQQVASGARPALIAPAESGNLAALEGWNKMPNPGAVAEAEAATIPTPEEIQITAEPGATEPGSAEPDAEAAAIEDAAIIGAVAEEVLGEIEAEEAAEEAAAE